MQKNNMELQILLVAKDLFVQHGYDGVSTTQVAKAAGCNQALVHYYYRTKQNLFKIIYQQEVNKMLQAIANIPQEDISFEEFIAKIVDMQMDFMMKNNNAPFFLIGELRKNSEVLAIMKDCIVNFRQEIMNKISAFIQMKQEKGEIKEVVIEDLLIDILSLNLISFVGQSFFAQILSMDSIEQEEFIARRKEHIKKLIVASINA